MSGALQKRIDRAKKAAKNSSSLRQAYLASGHTSASGKTVPGIDPNKCWSETLDDVGLSSILGTWRHNTEYNFAVFRSWCKDAEKSRSKKWVRKALDMSKEEYKLFMSGTFVDRKLD